MIGRTLYGACAIVSVAATALMAQTPATSGGSAKSNANKQICRTFGDTGSRLNRSRACHTEQEWIELRRQMKQNIDHIQNARPFNAG